MKKSTRRKQTSKVIVIRQEGQETEKTTQILEREKFQRKSQEIAKTLPSAAELAALTATLERGKPFSVTGAGESARNALMLWEVCHKHLESEKDKRTKDAIKQEDANRKELEVRKQIPSPSFPTRLSVFERLVVGGKNTTKRHQRFIKFLREYALPMKCHPGASPNFYDLPQATEKEVNEEVKRTEEELWTEQFYYHRAEQFHTWEHQTKSHKAWKGGKGLAEKRKSQVPNINPPIKL